MQQNMANSSSYSDTSLPRKRKFSASPTLIGRSSSLSDISAVRAEGRRRVNPESLATRLGPKLVKELEDLIKPGVSEMPPFSVRQEIQQRYNINRRHIYDWFHSKGLRVTKEEKRAKMEAHRAGAHAQRQIRQCLGVSSPSPTSHSPSVYGDGNDGHFGMLLSPPNQVATFRPGEPFIHTSPYFPSHYFGTPVYALPLDGSNTQASSPVYLSPAFSVDESGFAQTHAFVGIPSSFHANQLYDPMAEQEIFQTYGNMPSPAVLAPGEQIASLPPLQSEDYLPPPERAAYYDCLSGVLGPATGIQECVGSYKSFMTEQTQKYYERLLPGTGTGPSSNYAPSSTPTAGGPVAEVVSVSRRPLAAQLVRTSTMRHATISGNKENTAEYSNWLLYSGHSHSSSPAGTPDLSDCGTDISNSWRGDSTQPGSALDITEILESPVLRSRNSSSVQGPSLCYPQTQYGDDLVLGRDTSNLQFIPANHPGLQIPYATGPQNIPYPYSDQPFFAQQQQKTEASRGQEQVIKGKTRTHPSGNQARMFSNSAGCGL